MKDKIYFFKKTTTIEGKLKVPSRAHERLQDQILEETKEMELQEIQP